ncbi:response regulator transcription factor [Williamsia sp. CHRR-6]|nr:response regulator transcription factor [Williamsia sp. CHRR-6]
MSPVEPDGAATPAVRAVRPRILVVEDDSSIRTVVHWQLDECGFDVVEADDGAVALQILSREVPRLIVVDLTLPVVGGMDLIRAIRSGRAGVPVDVPVIILSGRSGECDRIAGLDSGADDYLIKPFSPGELAARVRSLLRRAGRPATTSVLASGPLRIDSISREVSVDGRDIDATAKEFDLLLFLASHPRQVFTRHQLLDTVWHSAQWLGEATVTEHIHRLRTKIGKAHGSSCIRTIRGVGYRFDPDCGGAG